MFPGPVRIVELDPLAVADADLFAAWYAAHRATAAHDFGDRAVTPSMAEVRAAYTEQAFVRRTLLAAVRDGTVVGTASLRLPLSDNQHLAFGRLDVPAAHRRRGVGSALLAALEERARADGRTVLTVEGAHLADGPDADTPFACTHGYEVGLVNLRSDLDLPGGADDVERLLAPLDCEVAAVAPADLDRYRLLSWWTDFPDEWIEDCAALMGRMSTDAPLGDLALEPEHWDADRLREQLRLARAQGRTVAQTYALDTRSGRLVGFTSMGVASHEPHQAHQWDTLVLREHRGARLGLRLKATNLRHLVGGVPTVRRVTTWNAAQNAPMLRVNRAMGFRVVGVHAEYQKTL